MKRTTVKSVVIIWIIAVIAGIAAIGYFNYAMAQTLDSTHTTATCAPPQFVRGTDKETGAVICGTVTGCPYGDSVPLGPECDKFTIPSASAPSTTLVQTSNEASTTPPVQVNVTMGTPVVDTPPVDAPNEVLGGK